ncbi:hypothetical protein Tco_1480349 [Tanacetum coccineum]
MAIARESANLHPKHSHSQTLSSSGPFPRIEAWPSPRIEAWPSPRIEAWPSPRIEVWLLQGSKPGLLQGSKPGLLQGYLVLGIITITTILFFDLHQSLVVPVFAQLVDLHPRLLPPGVVVSELPNDHFKVHFPHIGPLGLNKVITFEILCRSLEITLIVTLFKRHADSVITNPKPHTGSYDDSKVRRLSAFVMKLCDMPKGILVLPGLIRVWKSLTCDPILRGSDGNVIGNYDFLCLLEWEGPEVQEEAHHNERPTL